MKATEFNQIAEARIDHCRNTLILKGEEYSRDNDRLHNFKSAAGIDGETPEKALWGMLKKHIVSVRDMVADTERGIVPSKKMIDEKITDWINYGLLLEGLIMERSNHVEDNLEMAQAGCANIPPETRVPTPPYLDIVNPAPRTLGLTVEKGLPVPGSATQDTPHRSRISGSTSASAGRQLPAMIKR